MTRDVMRQNMMTAILSQVAGASCGFGVRSFELAEHRANRIMDDNQAIERILAAESDEDWRRVMADVLKACIAELEKR